VLAAPAMFSGLASAYDVPLVPLELDMGQVGEAVAGSHGLRHVVRFCRAMGQRAAGALPALAAVADGGADLVVHHPVLPLGQHVAERLGVPAVVGQLMPALVPTGQVPSTIWPGRLPGLLSRPSYRAARWLSGAWCRQDVDRWRRDVLGLPPRPGRHDPLVSGDGTPVAVLHAFSELEGLAKLHANGGTIALWPLVKALLAKDDTVMREFWHAKLSEMNPEWVTGTAESMADEPDRSDELLAAGIPSLVVFGKRDRRVWSHDSYAGMASRLRAEHVVIPKASHSPNMEQPEILAEALLGFFAAEDALGDAYATVAG